MRCWSIAALTLLLVACATPPVQESAFDTPSQESIPPQNVMPDSTHIADVGAPLEITNEPLPNPPGPTATQTMPATLLATPIDYVEYAGPTRFVNEDHGWMWTRSAVFNTDNGGQRWHERWTAPFITLQFVPHADFISEQQGWIVVTSSMSTTNISSLFATNDGGATWSELPVDPQLGAVHWIDFVDAEVGWMVTGDSEQAAPIHLLRTTDGGTTWAEVSDPCIPDLHDATRSVSFASPTTGWAMCTTWDGYVSSMHLFATTDGGQHWQKCVLPPAPPVPPSPSGHPHGTNPATPVPPAPNPPPPPIFFLDAMHGWIGGQYGDMFMTTDGGETWQHITVLPQSYQPISDIQFWSAAQGLASSSGAVFRTNDAGATWQRDVAGLRPSRVQFFDQQNGVGVSYAVEGAVLLRTDDGGSSWSSVGALRLECHAEGTLHFVDEMHGWSLGQRPTFHAPPVLCRTTDGGGTWTPLPDLHAAGGVTLSFLDADTGYLGTTGATWSMLTPLLQVTHDGGETWTPVSAEPVTAYQIEFLSPNVGWKLADWQLSATGDGGETWTPIPLGYRVNFFDLLPNGNAWVLAEDCNADPCERLVLSTTDNGATWTNHIFDATWLTPPSPGTPDPIASPEPGRLPYTKGVLHETTAITFVDEQHGWLVQAEYYLSNEQRRLWATMDGGRTWTMLE